MSDLEVYGDPKIIIVILLKPYVKKKYIFISRTIHLILKKHSAFFLAGKVLINEIKLCKRRKERKKRKQQ